MNRGETELGVELDQIYLDPDSLFENPITVKDVADLLAVSTKTIYKMAQSGDIPCKRVGTKYRFLRSQLMNWLKKG